MSDFQAWPGRLSRGLFAAAPATWTGEWIEAAAERVGGGAVRGVVLPAGAPVAAWRAAVGDDVLLLTAEAEPAADVLLVSPAGVAAAATDRPLLVRLDGPVDPAALRAALACPAVVGVLGQTEGDVGPLQDAAVLVKDEFGDRVVLGGIERCPSYNLTAGASGLVTSLALIEPTVMARLMRHWFDGHTLDFCRLAVFCDLVAGSLHAAGAEAEARLRLALADDGLATGVELPAGQAELFRFRRRTLVGV